MRTSLTADTAEARVNFETPTFCHPAAQAFRRSHAMRGFRAILNLTSLARSGLMLQTVVYPQQRANVRAPVNPARAPRFKPRSRFSARTPMSVFTMRRCGTRAATPIASHGFSIGQLSVTTGNISTY
jgi:hypothetical protein